VDKVDPLNQLLFFQKKAKIQELQIMLPKEWFKKREKLAMRWALLATFFTLTSYLVYSPTTKIVTHSSENSVDFQLTTRRYISKGRSLYMLIFKPKSYRKNG
jgi:hypothetical protein